MALNLLVDSGNSRIKWMLAGDDGSVAARGTASADVEAMLDKAWRRLPPPERIAVANVRGNGFEEEICRWCHANWRREAWFLRSTDTNLGIENGYREPHHLGSDRVAALIGARSLSDGAVLVVDCGTAITVDLLDADNRFRGGVIMPGPELAAQALRQRAPGIAATPAVAPAPASVLGTSTAACIASGTLYGAAGAVDRVLDEMSRCTNGPENGPLTVFLTGGDGERLRKLLRHAVDHRPDLVLTGLLEAVKRRC